LFDEPFGGWRKRRHGCFFVVWLDGHRSVPVRLTGPRSLLAAPWRGLLGIAAITAVTVVAAHIPAQGAAAAPSVSDDEEALCQARQQARATKGEQPGTCPGSGSSPPKVVTGPTHLPASTGGRWSDAAATIPDEAGAVHAVGLPTGKVLLIAGSANEWERFEAGTFSTWVWDPDETDPDRAFLSVPTPTDLFCAGHSLLADGTVLVAGGTATYPVYDDKGTLIHDWEGSRQAYIFDPADNRYHEVEPMANARWYPSAVTGGDGRVVVAGGLDDQARKLGVTTHDTHSVERYDPAARSWTALPELHFSTSDPSYPVPAGPPGSTRSLPYYPGLVQLEDGRIFYSGASSGNNGVRPGVWDPDTGGFQSLDGLALPYQRNAAATVLLPPAQDQRVMVIGGGDERLPTTASTAIIDLKGVSTPTNPAPAFRAGPPMSAARMYVGAVLLPDRTVLVTNGASSFRRGGVHVTEIYDPAAGSFRTVNSSRVDRLYHSSALLLEDGRVAAVGSQELDGTQELRISIYRPTYLFNGPRPNINFGVRDLDRTGGRQGYYDISVADGSRLHQLSLVRPSATTHSLDTDQRLVNLPFHRHSDGRGWSIEVPTNPNLVPPGSYMLFAVDDRGRASRAHWVHVT
jgi:hypothetical protein